MPGENWVRTLIRIGEGGSVQLGLSASGELTSVAAIVVVAPAPFDGRRRGARWYLSDGLTWVSGRRRTPSWTPRGEIRSDRKVFSNGHQTGISH